MKRKNVKLFLLFSLIVVFCACGEKNGSKNQFSDIEHRGQKAISIDQLHFDTMNIDASTTSLNGSWSMDQDTIYFSDNFSVSLLMFDANGQLIRRELIQGNGPDELIAPLLYFVHLDDGGFVGIDPNFNFVRFNKHYRKVNIAKYLHEVGYEDKDWANLLANPDPQNKNMYEVNVGNYDLLQQGSSLIVPILTEHIHYNGYEMPVATRFYNEAYTFALVDLESFETTKIFGGYPPIYTKKNIPTFSHYSIAKDNNGLLNVAFRADSLIYVYDENQQLAYCYGYGGDRVDDDYAQTSTFDQAQKTSKRERKEKGYYQRIECVGQYVFRQYKIEIEDQYRMQIYKDCDLVGDVSIPSASFKVIGYIAPYYYAYGSVDESKDQFVLYKFSL